MRRNLAILSCLLGLLVAIVAAAPANATKIGDLDISVRSAPVAPDGLGAGAITDFIVTFRDIDPTVPGVGLHAGGSIRVKLPEGFRNDGVLPVTGTGTIPGCAPPLVSTCSTAVILQGWPQSPQLPFPDVVWEADTNTIVVTAKADWLPSGVASPGPKQVHLMLFGFTNPPRPGKHKIDVEIRPNPNTDEVLQDSGRARISRRIRPTITPNSQANGSPPPPFPNTLFQTVQSGDPSLTLSFYLWARDGVPLIGADFDPGSARKRSLRDEDGHRVGWISVKPPRGARNWSLESEGPSTVATAFVTGIDTGNLRAVLHTDPDVAGVYQLKFQLVGGTTVRHTITAE